MPQVMTLNRTHYNVIRNKIISDPERKTKPGIVNFFYRLDFMGKNFHLSFIYYYSIILYLFFLYDKFKIIFSIIIL